MNNCCNIESLQYNVALAITGAIRGSSKEKLCQEMSFEYLRSRRWLRKLCLFYKTVVNKSPNYLCNYVSTVNQSYKSFYVCPAEQNILRSLSFFSCSLLRLTNLFFSFRSIHPKLYSQIAILEILENSVENTQVVLKFSWRQ